MANTIKLKRSATVGKIPLITDVELGELAMNTVDGKLFMKKSGAPETIVEIGGEAETPATIKTKYESNADTNALTDDGEAKLDNIVITEPDRLQSLKPVVYIGAGVSGSQLYLNNKLGENSVVSGLGKTQTWYVGTFPKSSTHANDLVLFNMDGGIVLDIKSGEKIRTKEGTVYHDLVNEVDLAKKVDKAGDTMTGNLTINSGGANMFRLDASVGKTIAMGTDGNALPEFSITGAPAKDYVFNLFTDPAGGAPNAWSLKFKIADGNLGLTDQAGSAVTPSAPEDLINKKFFDDHSGAITEQPAIGNLAVLSATPTIAEFNNMTKKINQILKVLRDTNIIAT